MFSLLPSYAYKLLSEWKNWMTCLNCVRTTQIHKSSLSFILVLVVMDKRIYQKLNYSCLMIRLMLEMKSNFLLYHVTWSYLVCCVHNILCKKKKLFLWIIMNLYLKLILLECPIMFCEGKYVSYFVSPMVYWASSFCFIPNLFWHIHPFIFQYLRKKFLISCSQKYLSLEMPY